MKDGISEFFGSWKCWIDRPASPTYPIFYDQDWRMWIKYGEGRFEIYGRVIETRAPYEPRGHHWHGIDPRLSEDGTALIANILQESDSGDNPEYGYVQIQIVHRNETTNVADEIEETRFSGEGFLKGLFNSSKIYNRIE